MDPAIDSSLESAIERMSLPGIMIGHRLIAPGDEYALKPIEFEAFASSVTRVRRASGAARIVARSLLAQLGYSECAVPKAPSGAPIWPTGVFGSLAHDSRIAVAAVATSRTTCAVGIDIEPAEVLPLELLNLVANPQERLQIGGDLLQGKLLFAAKEAVYKAVFPLDRIFLEHHDIQVNFAESSARVRNGRVVELRFCIAAHLVVVAFLRVHV